MRAALVLLLLAGCPTRHAEWTEDPPTERSDRFAGEWLVDQPFHALYEASWYRFGEDGDLDFIRSCSFGEPIDYQTGQVGDEAQAVACVFGDRWHSLDDATLVVGGVCDDRVDREIVLGFPGDASGNAGPAGVTEITVVSVGGEDGWAHHWPEWRWMKCDPSAPEACTEFDPCQP